MLYIVLAIILLWSIQRHTHAHRVTRRSLIGMPLVLIGIGVLAQIGSSIPTGRAAAFALIVLVAASILFGIRRGEAMQLWRTEDGSWMSKGNHTTIGLWVGLIAFTFALGIFGSATGLFPVEAPGEVFVALGLSFVAQNLVVARRSIMRPTEVAGVAA